MTIDELQRNLDVIRAWRKLELSHARSIAEQYTGRAELPYLCRAWTMMIYAHCDQTLKLVCKEYLAFLSSVPREEYDYKTVWLSFFGKDAIRNGAEARFHMCRDNSSEVRPKFLSNINGKEVFASGNFSYKQLRFFTEWVLQSPFDHAIYSAFCDTLKEKRDGIAHGEETMVESIEDCIAWHDPAINLFDALVDSTIDAALTH